MLVDLRAATIWAGLPTWQASRSTDLNGDWRYSHVMHHRQPGWRSAGRQTRTSGTCSRPPFRQERSAEPRKSEPCRLITSLNRRPGPYSGVYGPPSIWAAPFNTASHDSHHGGLPTQPGGWRVSGAGGRPVGRRFAAGKPEIRRNPQQARGPAQGAGLL